MSSFKSQFEKNFAKSLRDSGIKFEYEPMVVSFLQPEKQRKYIPDFKIRTKEGVFIVETKGKLTIEDRKKLVWVAEQHPKLNLIIVFMNSKNKLRKNSPTTYGQWATKNGFTWYDFRDGLPNEWK
jgi:predicted nuclease of restriction endonuclease-like RecB superfamily